MISLMTNFLLLTMTALGTHGTAIAAVNTVVVAIGEDRASKPGLAPLKYAEKDAERFADAMRMVGAVDHDRLVVRTGVTVAEFRKTFSDIYARHGKALSEQNSRFVFYFSGHADDVGLQLKDGILPKQELHRILEQSAAKTKVNILDTCFSGALAKRGVEKSEAFELPRLELDAPRGSIFLSASSDKQMAYESDGLGGGIFTHFLVQGLYGDADGNADGLVTIDELYQYVYKSTKWQSINTPASSQDPAFHTELEGNGAIVMSFPTRKYSAITFAKDLAGHITIVSKVGMLFFEYQKKPSEAKAVNLPVGNYDVSIHSGHKFGRATILVQGDATTSLGTADFDWTSRVGPVAASRGAADGMAGGVVADQARDSTNAFIVPSDHDSGRRLRIGLGSHSGYWNENDSVGALVAISAEKIIAGRGRWLQLLGGVKLGFHHNEDSLDSEIPFDASPTPGHSMSRKELYITNSTEVFGRLGPRIVFGQEANFFFAVSSFAGIGESYHDQRRHGPRYQPEPGIEGNILADGPIRREISGAGARPVGEVGLNMELGLWDRNSLIFEFGMDTVFDNGMIGDPGYGVIEGMYFLGVFSSSI